MQNEILDAQRQYWNQAFAQGDDNYTSQNHWLDELAKYRPLPLTGPILEIGCGQGYDTGYLLQAGGTVTCFDLSWVALQNAAQRNRSLQLVNGALPDPLPFRANSFAIVVAGLSLHYFLWDDTCAIVEEISRVLQEGGLFIFRVNSTEDVLHGAGRGEKVEPNLYFYRGRYKRFFTEEMCHQLFDEQWQLQTLISWVETRSDQAKPTWMGIARYNGA